MVKTSAGPASRSVLPSSGRPGTLFLPFQPFRELFVLCPGALGAWARMLPWLDAAFPALCPCPQHRGRRVRLSQMPTGVTSHPDNLPSALGTGWDFFLTGTIPGFGFVPNQIPSDAGAPSAGREGLGYQRQRGTAGELTRVGGCPGMEGARPPGLSDQVT